MRRGSFDKIIVAFCKLYVRLKAGDAGCCFEQSAMLLGAFVLCTRDANILEQIKDDAKPIEDTMSFQEASL
jgi:hypothetical protein